MAALLESHCIDSSFPGPQGAETARQRLEWTLSDLTVDTKEDEKGYIKSFIHYFGCIENV